ncbi:MAG TPA: FAD-dependent monooxygenase [Propionibacteriaceae bacterium]|nr:FAD-dependent monooxygenase [Propionibacteriaceae bacterium]
MRCVGGGPAGLMFAILARSVGHDVTVYEQVQPEESFGWGVVFWDGLLRQLDAHDAETGRLVREHAYTWTDQVVVVDGRDPVRIPSFGYSMRRRLLLELLRSRATEVGVHIEEGRVTDADAVARGADLVIASDGVKSTLRQQQAGFGTRTRRLRNKYIWLGSDQEFGSFTFPFVRTHSGWVWGHAYGFDKGASTFVVEMEPETWTGLGFDRMSPEATMTELEHLFEDSLEGHRLFPPVGTKDRTPWTEFVVVRNRRWHVGNLVLMGDAAHTTHYTIGSGTRLAMEDAMTLSTALAAEPSQPAALAAYEATRQRQLREVQREAMRSARWYENVPRYIGASEVEFATLMDDRRSPVMARLPVGVYLGLTRTANKVPGVAEPLRRLVSKL